MFDSFPLDDTGCDFLFAGRIKATFQKQGLLTKLPENIGNLISSSSYYEKPTVELDDEEIIEEETMNYIPSQDWNSKPITEVYIINNETNETIIYPVRIIQVASITECSDGLLIKSTEKNSTYYLVPSHFKNKLMKRNIIKIAYVEKELVKPRYKIELKGRFGKTIGGIIIREIEKRKGFYREVKKIYGLKEKIGIDFL